ncbi:NAD(P)H-quinone oxidoreductase subunit O, chloroplastic [Rutidosis leptorrhynchoides]|uniref:NAD(P)H-quinone oxidoreductase subunit O, chloroplastic n=1 Tax=Rutidosis leptorrhynchoides TaxID=125765 RepID=UPI003A9989BE
MAMAYSSTFSSFPYTKPHTPPPTTTTTTTITKLPFLPTGGRFCFSIAVKSPESADPPPPPAAAATETPVLKPPKKPVYSMKKGQIVRVEKEKYLNSVNYLSVGHPPYYKGLDYIYEDRGEVLDIRIFETGEYALIAWIGVPTAPAWLPTDMLIKSDKLNYERI